MTKKDLFRTACYKFCLELRRNLLSFLLLTILYLILSVVIFILVSFSAVLKELSGGTTLFSTVDTSIVRQTVYAVIEDYKPIFTCGGAVSTLLLVLLVCVRLPLKLPKAFYACAAGEQEKLGFLKQYLFLKLGFCVFIVLLATTLTGTGFLFSSPQAMTIQLLLTVFSVLAFSLNTDPGNRKELKKQSPDLLSEQSSKTLVSVYWSALLIVENTVFYTLTFMETRWTWPLAAAWIPVFLANGILALLHTEPVLRHIIRYENIYLPAETYIQTEGDTL